MQLIKTIQKIIKYILIIFIIQYLIIILIEIYFTNKQILEKDLFDNTNIVKHMIINYKLLYKIYTYNSKFKIENLKKNELNLISNSKYYYYLINKDNIVCSIYEYDNKPIIFFNGLLNKDIKITNIFKNISSKYYMMKYDLILISGNKIKRIFENIEIYDAIKFISQKHNTYNFYIYSICFGSYVADLFINQIVKKNKIQINNYYIYESFNYNTKKKYLIEKKNHYIYNNGSHFLFLGLMFKLIKKNNTSIININKFSFDYFYGLIPLYSTFLKKHVLTIYNKLDDTIL
jgi:hypothetical protein